MKITGTFLDEITYDIPSQNWGAREWAKDFDAMKKVGIDTVILIRVGMYDFLAFPCESAKKYFKPMKLDIDLVDIFLRESEKHNMQFYFGTYDSNTYWQKGEYQKEIDMNKDIVGEFFQKYGHRKALKGWYISHEIHSFHEPAMKVYESLAVYLKKLKEMPILISPYWRGSKISWSKPLSYKDHRAEWEKTFDRIKGFIDIVAFQDGLTKFDDELDDYLKVDKELADKYKIRCWSNVETFDRDMPIKFPAISWRKMLRKMEAAIASGVEKLITFEFSHFMSPNSINLEARNLFDRYCEWLKKNK